MTSPWVRALTPPFLGKFMLISSSFKKKINLFVYLWLHWIFVAASELSLVVRGLFLFWSMGSRACGLQ